MQALRKRGCGWSLAAWSVLFAVAPALADARDKALKHFNRGFRLEVKGDLDGAIAEYGEALRLKPDYAEAHANLGVALEDRGNLEGAIAEYREALRLKPDFPQGRIGLGRSLEKQGDGKGVLD